MFYALWSNNAWINTHFKSENAYNQSHGTASYTIKVSRCGYAPTRCKALQSDVHPSYLRRLLGENFTRRARTKFPPIQCNKTAVEGNCGCETCINGTYACALVVGNWRCSREPLLIALQNLCSRVHRMDPIGKYFTMRRTLSCLRPSSQEVTFPSCFCLITAIPLYMHCMTRVNSCSRDL